MYGELAGLRAASVRPGLRIGLSGVRGVRPTTALKTPGRRANSHDQQALGPASMLPPGRHPLRTEEDICAPDLLEQLLPSPDMLLERSMRARPRGGDAVATFGS